MKTISSLSILAFSCGMSASGFAANPGNASQMTLQDLKTKCVELAGNEQLKPFKAVVTCNQVITQWRPSAQPVDSVKIQNAKQIGAAFSLKGYAVPFTSEDIEVAPSEGACAQLEQIKLTVPAVDIELDCSALDQVQKLADLCGPAIEERIAADPSIQVEEVTGQIFNTCMPQVTQQPLPQQPAPQLPVPQQPQG